MVPHRDQKPWNDWYPWAGLAAIRMAEMGAGPGVMARDREVLGYRKRPRRVLSFNEGLHDCVNSARPCVLTKAASNMAQGPSLRKSSPVFYSILLLSLASLAGVSCFRAACYSLPWAFPLQQSSQRWSKFSCSQSRVLATRRLLSFSSFSSASNLRRLFAHSSRREDGEYPQLDDDDAAFDEYGSWSKGGTDNGDGMSYYDAKVGSYDEIEDDLVKIAVSNVNHGKQSVLSQTEAENPWQQFAQQLEQQQAQIDTLMQLVSKGQDASFQLEVATDSSAFMINGEPKPTVSVSPSTPLSNAVATPPQPVMMTPLKTMLFIDGTWLYYSIYERDPDRCPIYRHFGPGWQARYTIDWAVLPRIISEAMMDPGWMTTTSAVTTTTVPVAHQQQDGSRSKQLGQLQEQQHHQYLHRPVEIVRASVFTSYKADTSVHSFRYKMFQAMKEANYDVHMMETVGKNEKCVDIQLAVDMLHYATVPSAYDVAILLSGDKDFIPAMIRTRQKGRKVALCAFRLQCNRALYETDGLRDYDPIWLDDYLHRLLQPKPGKVHIGGAGGTIHGINTASITPTSLVGAATNSPASELSSPDSLVSSSPVPHAVSVAPHNAISMFTLTKILVDFVLSSGVDRVSSRDVGRYLKFLRIGDRSVSEEIKGTYGGLYQFVHHVRGSLFQVIHRDEEIFRENTSDHAFWIMLQSTDEDDGTDNRDDRIRQILMEEAQRTTFSPAENVFFEKYYSTSLLRQTRAMAYQHTLLVHKALQEQKRMKQTESLRDYTLSTVAELKEMCRERGLPVSGTKAVLMDRIRLHLDAEIGTTHRQAEIGTTRQGPGTDSTSRPGSPTDSRTVEEILGRPAPDESVANYLRDVLIEYIQACGGRAGSRNLGRYLSQNRASGNQEGPTSALQELKTAYGSLSAFVLCFRDYFERVEEEASSQSQKPNEGQFEFIVCLRDQSAKKD